MTGIEIQQALNDLCEDVKNKLSGFRFCGILKSSDSTIISRSYSFDSQLETANNVAPLFGTIVDQVKQVVALCAAAGVTETHSILIETNKATFVVGISNKGKFFIVIVLERDKANIGIARSLIERSRPLATILDEQLA